jgi:hypothetical protein
MTAYRVVYTEGVPRVVMAHDITEALRLGRLYSTSTIRVVTSV